VGVNKGGMYIQIKKTAEALQQYGVSVVFHNPWENELADCDICHVFSTHEAVYGMLDAAVSSSKPVVWSTVFNVFKRPMWQLRMQVGLSKILPGFYPIWKNCHRVSSLCNHVILLNEDEQFRFQSLFPSIKNKVSIIPNGVDFMFNNGDKMAFMRHFGLSPGDKYVLNVGIICERKNQLTLIRAAKGKSWKLVIVGPYSESIYSKQCRHEAASCDNVIMTGALPYHSDLLAGAYAGAKVFCLPSFSEVQPLTLIEAAVAGCSLVASNQVPIMPSLKGHVLLCVPDNIKELQKSIERGLDSLATAREVILKQPTWHEIGRKVACVYKQLVNK
jgi:hypothetical protein